MIKRNRKYNLQFMPQKDAKIEEMTKLTRVFWNKLSILEMGNRVDGAIPQNLEHRNTQQ